MVLDPEQLWVLHPIYLETDHLISFQKPKGSLGEGEIIFELSLLLLKVLRGWIASIPGA
jgi:hypothetical protein